MDNLARTIGAASTARPELLALRHAESVEPLGAPFHPLCMRVRPADGGPGHDVAVAPQPGLLPLLARRPDLARRVVVVGDDAFARWAERSVPAELSARTDHSPPTLPAGVSMVALTLGAPLAFAVAAGVRAFALADTFRDPVPGPRWPLWDDELPTYTVLVPLYREASVVPDLAKAMLALDYPADRLEVLVLLEQGDRETLDAARRHMDGRPFRIIVVPDGRPRTKPRACNFGLAHASGEIVVIYDGEDRPEPDQLRRAAELLAADSGLAVVQARLACDHAEDAPWVTRMWALDYDLLFAAVLPALSRGGIPFLLGGTSNHFRRRVLADAGGWDAWNVTEDADLAVRLARMGWRSATVDSVTREEAPVTVGAWLRQRSRWLKGFAVTTMVHVARPIRLVRELGPRSALALIAQLPATLLSIAAYPLSLLLVASGALDVANPLTWLMCLGHLSSFALAFRVAASQRSSPGVRAWLVLTLPLYWLLLSAALLLALYEMATGQTFRWSKTEHGVARRPSAQAGGSRGPAPTT